MVPLQPDDPEYAVWTDGLVAAGFEESEHPRWPKGHPDGGKFKPKGGDGFGEAPPFADEWIAAVKAGVFFGDYATYMRERSRVAKEDEAPLAEHWKGTVTEGEPVAAKMGEPIPIGRQTPVAKDAHGDSLGSDRDPDWNADPITPQPTDFRGETFDAVENSDTVWAGETNPAMQYDIDRVYMDETIDRDYQDRAPGEVVDGEALKAKYQNDVEDRMRDVTEEGELRINTPLDTMEDILDDGRFKNQFETARSQGAYLPNIRAAQEQMFFGYPLDMKGEWRPIYGWMEHPDYHPPQLDQYGEVTWHLKKENLQDRTTVSFVDSLSRPVVPGPYRNPGWRATVPPGYEDNGMGGMITDHDYETGLLDDIVETQYHGGLTLDDVSGVTIEYDQHYSSFSEVAVEEWAERLRKQGIRVDVRHL